MQSKNNSQKNAQEKFLVLLCGLPGTGKTVVAHALQKTFPDYAVIEQNEIRRKQGMKRMPKSQDPILREIDQQVAEHLKNGRGVIVDSVHRYSFRRHQLYGVASSCRVRVLTLEIVCGEKTAKQRIYNRKSSDGLLSDPNNPFIYDRLKNLWENVMVDFRYPGEDHVGYVQFDSEKNEFKKYVVQKGMHPFIQKIKKNLRNYLEDVREC